MVIAYAVVVDNKIVNNKSCGSKIYVKDDTAQKECKKYNKHNKIRAKVVMLKEV